MMSKNAAYLRDENEEHNQTDRYPLLARGKRKHLVQFNRLDGHELGATTMGHGSESSPLSGETSKVSHTHDSLSSRLQHLRLNSSSHELQQSPNDPKDNLTYTKENDFYDSDAQRNDQEIESIDVPSKMELVVEQPDIDLESKCSVEAGANGQDVVEKPAKTHSRLPVQPKPRKRTESGASKGSFIGKVVQFCQKKHLKSDITVNSTTNRPKSRAEDVKINLKVPSHTASTDLKSEMSRLTSISLGSSRKCVSSKRKEVSFTEKSENLNHSKADPILPVEGSNSSLHGLKKYENSELNVETETLTSLSITPTANKLTGGGDGPSYFNVNMSEHIPIFTSQSFMHFSVKADHKSPTSTTTALQRRLKPQLTPHRRQMMRHTPITTKNPGDRSAPPLSFRIVVASGDGDFSQRRLFKKRFFVNENTNFEDILADSNDRRVLAICNRFHCKMVALSKAPRKGALKHEVILSASCREDIAKCARCLDSRLNWCISPQLK